MFRCEYLAVMDMVVNMYVGGQTAALNTFNKWNEGRGCLHE